jgi:hypothetical protein
MCTFLYSLGRYDFPKSAVRKCLCTLPRSVARAAFPGEGRVSSLFFKAYSLIVFHFFYVLRFFNKYVLTFFYKTFFTLFL